MSVRIGLCGCGGFIENAVLPMLSRVDLARITAAFDVNAAARDRVCAKFGIRKRCDSYEELLAADVDVIYIASPNAWHKDQTLRAARAGKHVFCQKPMALNAAECREMIAGCRDRGAQLGLGFCYRFQGAQEMVRCAIRDGVLGRVSYLHFSFNLPGYNPATVGWRCDPKLSGGGPLMDLAPHLIDLSRFFLDDEVQWVMADALPNRTDQAIELDARVMMRMRQGAGVSLDISFARGNLHNYTVVGEKGQIRAIGTMCWNNAIPGIGKGLVFLEQGMESRPLDYATEDHIEKEMRLFCRAVNTGAPAPVTGWDGLQVQLAIDASYASAQTGTRVSLPLA